MIYIFRGVGSREREWLSRDQAPPPLWLNGCSIHRPPFRQVAPVGVYMAPCHGISGWFRPRNRCGVGVLLTETNRKRHKFLPREIERPHLVSLFLILTSEDTRHNGLQKCHQRRHFIFFFEIRQRKCRAPNFYCLVFIIISFLCVPFWEVDSSISRIYSFWLTSSISFPLRIIHFNGFRF